MPAAVSGLAQAARVHAVALRTALRTGPLRLPGVRRAPGGARGPRSAQEPARGLRSARQAVSAPSRAVSVPAGPESGPSLASWERTPRTCAEVLCGSVVFWPGTSRALEAAGGAGGRGPPQGGRARLPPPGSAEDPAPRRTRLRRWRPSPRGMCVCAVRRLPPPPGPGHGLRQTVHCVLTAPGECPALAHPRRPSLPCRGDRAALRTGTTAAPGSQHRDLWPLWGGLPAWGFRLLSPSKPSVSPRSGEPRVPGGQCGPFEFRFLKLVFIS